MATPRIRTTAQRKAGLGKPRGQPQKYDRATLVPLICERLATGEPHAVILRDLGLKLRTVNQWRQDDAEIAAQFDEARDLGFDAIAAECMAIADTPQLGVIEKLELLPNKDGGSRMVVTERRNEDMLGHRKLQIETRLKLLSKWDPRRYGDKLDVNHGGQPGNPVSLTVSFVKADERASD